MLFYNLVGGFDALIEAYGIIAGKIKRGRTKRN
jgi:hypothetical protein